MRWIAVLLSVLAYAATMCADPAAAWAGPPPISTERKAELEKLFDLAKEDYGAKRYSEALPRFQTVADELGSPIAMLYVARCLHAMGRDVEAYRAMETARAVAAERAPAEPRYAETRAAADKELAELAGHVGLVTVHLNHAPPGTVVEVAGERIEDLDRPVVVAPGHVRIVGHGHDVPDVHAELDVAAGTKENVVLDFVSIPVPSPTPAPAPSPRPEPDQPAEGGLGTVRIAGFAVLGLSVASWVTVIATGVLANERFADTQAACGESACTTEAQQDDIDEGRVFEIVANVGIGVGAATAVAGALMVIFGGPSEPAAGVDAAVGPHGALVSWRGHF